MAALVAAPTAGAAASSKASAAPKAQSAQSKKTLNRRISSVRRRTARAERRLRALATQLGVDVAALRGLISSGDTTIDNKINTIVATVTPILTRLGEGLTAAGEGLVALKAGVETLAAKTTEGFDLVEENLTKVATSQEYGIVGVFAAPGGGATCCRLITTGSADIPDDGNPVSAGGTLPIRVNDGTGGTLPPDSEVFIHAAIRSGETDGVAGGDEAGQVGGLMTVKCASIGGCGNLPIGPGGADVPIQSGDLVCSVGPTPNNYAYDPPGDTPAVNLGLVGIPERSDRTDQTQPSAATSAKTVNPLFQASESDAGAAATGDPAANATDKRCTLANPGTYELDVQVQFLDLPTSEDPEIDD